MNLLHILGIALAAIVLALGVGFFGLIWAARWALREL